MSEQGITYASGEEAVEGWVKSVAGIVEGCVEIHLSEVLKRKYGNSQLSGTMIFTLPDGTITGHITCVLKYMLNVVYGTEMTGMDLVDHLISEIKKLDLEVSENVE